jgi:hypothetical protein
MRHINYLACLAILVAMAAFLTVAPPALAEAGYQVVFNDYAYSGVPVQAGGCTVTATLGDNNSTAVLIKVSQIGSDDQTGTVEPGMRSSTARSSGIGRRRSG